MGINEIVESCATVGNGFAQNLAHALKNSCQLCWLEFADFSLWGDSGGEENFVGINVANPGNQTLIKQEAFDIFLWSSLSQPLKSLLCEMLSQRLKAKAAFDFLKFLWGDDLQKSKLAQVVEKEAIAI